MDLDRQVQYVDVHINIYRQKTKYMDSTEERERD